MGFLRKLLNSQKFYCLFYKKSAKFSRTFVSNKSQKEVLEFIEFKRKLEGKYGLSTTFWSGSYSYFKETYDKLETIGKSIQWLRS